MTKVMPVQNVNEALAGGITYLLNKGEEETSRNGSVIVAPSMVITEYHNPVERVVFSPTRDANCFFHLMESMWMLAGRNDLEFPKHYNKRFGEYSDDGKTVHGAYGWRWRESFGYDQLKIIIDELKKNPTSRRCVLAMWDATPEISEARFEHGRDDLRLAVSGGRDVPCNTHAYFDARFGVLNMTVCNRSNDAIWGAYGANAVHFSILQEYMAVKIGIPVGIYRQASNNFHVYTDIYDRSKLYRIANESMRVNYYSENLFNKSAVKPHELATENMEDFDSDLNDFFTNEVRTPRTEFFKTIIQPMYSAWEMWKKKQLVDAFGCLEYMPENNDWRRAATEWLERRQENAKV